MKKYMKPMLEIMPLNGSEQLCGSCANAGGLLLNNDAARAEDILWLSGGDTNGNGVPDRADFNVIFGTGESCTREVAGYCKFTGAVTVAWS